LEQVVINLLRNACQALEHRDQTISLRAERIDENRIAIRVTDTGQGIAPTDMPHVFEPFFTTRRESGNTGLGLSVAFGIAHDHGGHMTIESSLHSGTTVSLVLPRNT
jgi:two-component system, NtrC family, sensor kinase